MSLPLSLVHPPAGGLIPPAMHTSLMPVTAQLGVPIAVPAAVPAASPRPAAGQAWARRGTAHATDGSPRKPTAASVSAAAKAALEAGTIQRKQCNCKNSKCLKLYCECFAAGMQCQGCNCRDCGNTEEHIDRRIEAMETILERNPAAFAPKIAPSAHTPRKGGAAAAGKANSTLKTPDFAAANATEGAAAVLPLRQQHNKGCNCKKSHCLKKYCECFQAGIYCGEHCRCLDCQNVEGSKERSALEAKGHAIPVPRLLNPHSPAVHSGASTAAMPVPRGILTPLSQHVHAPWSHLLTAELVKNLTRQLLEAAASESRSAAVKQEDASHAEALLSMLSPQKPKMEPGQEVQTPQGNSASRGRRTHATPTSKKSLQFALGLAGSSNPLVASPGGLSTQPIPAATMPLAPSEPQSRTMLFSLPGGSSLASTPTVKQSALASVQQARLQAEADSRSAVIHAAASRALPLPTLNIIPRLSPTPSATASTPSSARQLLSTLQQQQQQQHAPVATLKRRLDETVVAPGASSSHGSLPASSSPHLGNAKRVKLEGGQSAPSPPPTNPATGRPSSPLTASLLCDESELASSAQLDQLLKAELNEQQARSAASASAASPHAVTPPAQAEIPAVQTERLQERAVLNDVARVMQMFVDRVQRDQQRMRAEESAATVAAPHASSSQVPTPLQARG